MILNMGFDIGDAETIISFLKGNSNAVTDAMMPGKNAAGQAIPTLYGYTKDGKLQLADSVASDGSDLKKVAMNFKRCPSDIVQVNKIRQEELKIMTDEELWRQPEMNTPKVKEYDEKLNTFIKVVLTHPDFEKILIPQLDDCDECRVCVGHPTRWSDFEVRIYRALLQHGMLGQDKLLGKKLSLVLEKESRAAFLYLRDAYQIRKRDNEFIAVIDVGSSTIDISVMKGGDARNCVYNDGQNFLGARSIDYLIMEECIRKLSHGEMAEEFQDIFVVDANGKKKNPGAWDHMLINCRFAKEALFSASSDDKSKLRKWINVLDFPPVGLKYTELVDDICNRPVANVLRKYCDLSEEDYARMGDKNWKEAFREFLTEQKNKMGRIGIKLSQIFLTGSASRMVFVREICRDVFPEITNTQNLMDDTSPSTAIANGLARVGASEDRAKAFTEDISKFLDSPDGLRSMVKTRVPDLISDIAEPTVDVIRDDIIVPNFRKWQTGEIHTVNALMDSIESSLKNESMFNELLQNNRGFSQGIGKWISDKLGADIGTRLESFATKYKVHDFEANELNAFKIDIGGGVYSGKKGSLNLTDAISYDQITGVLSGILGIIAFFVAPYIVGVLVGLTAIISESVFWSILSALLAVPDPIFLGLLVIIGGAAALLTKTVFSNNKGAIEKWLNNRDLPLFVRRKVDMKKLVDTFNADKSEIVSKLQQSFNDQSKQDEIAEKISRTIKPQIQKKADEIKYVIESR